MNNNLLISIIKYLAATIDDALLPQTTISSLGLKLALSMKLLFEELMAPQGDIERHALFAESLVKLFQSELDCNLAIESIQEDRISLKIANCPFQCVKTGSLCSITQGIIGGFGLMTFGYCKVVLTDNPNPVQKPCCIDLYTSPTEEAQDKTGIEYSKNSVVLLKGTEEKLITNHRQERRKALLTLFTNLGFSLRRNRSAGEIANRFIEGLSCMMEIEVAALYLRDSERDSFMLTANFGLREDIIPLVREIKDEVEYVHHTEKDEIKLTNDIDWCELGVCRKTVKSFSTFKLKFENRVVGLLNIGWKSGSSLDTEYSETLRSACSLLAAVIDNNRLYFELEKAYLDGIGLLSRLVHVVERFMKDHSKRVAELAELIGLQMGLPQEKASLLYEAGFIHDIGKIAVPSEILTKAGQMTSEEFEMVKQHPVLGANILAPITMYREILPAVQYHHERLDGSGYPEGLKGDKIPLSARIIAVADVYDALTSDRPYRKAEKEENVLTEIINSKGTKYDPDVVDALVEVLKTYKKSDSSPSGDTLEQLRILSNR